ncbi:hypothetical protein EWM64_g4694 [Hericium alpestre]|uniref:NADP-dependent oxidoreductase domain-containing protein n=1 Tax=Hericium alpestre TaxID=135208 RepID=A0A4Z0A0U8_9AGAM|nr:hypothetical protein EWM64_g4694 [Hericium alpestre]
MAQPTKRMPYVRLGTSGLKVSRIILGCMSYGSPEWQAWVLGEEESFRHIKAAYDLGIQTFDTANTYSNGLSEVILGKAIKKYNLPCDEIVVMTKLWFAVGRTPSEVNWSGGDDERGYVNHLSCKHIFESVKHSLDRLQLDYFDVLQCSAQTTHNLTPFISMQNHYSLLYREEEREMMPTLKVHFGVGSIPWSPLACGILTRPYGEETIRANTDGFAQGYGGVGTKEIVARVEVLAKKKGVSMAQTALACMLTKDVVSAPIIGTTSLEKLQDLVKALDVKLTEDEVEPLEEPYTPRSIFGHM